MEWVDVIDVVTPKNSLKIYVGEGVTVKKLLIPLYLT